MGASAGEHFGKERGWWHVERRAPPPPRHFVYLNVVMQDPFTVTPLPVS
jgi:hypothetical protein